MAEGGYMPSVICFDIENKEMIKMDLGDFEKIEWTRIGVFPNEYLSGGRCTFSAVAVKDTLYVMTWMKEFLSISLSGSAYGYPYWEVHPKPFFPHGKWPALTAVYGRIYVCAGGWEIARYCRKYRFRCPRFSANCEKYDPYDDAWTPISRLPLILRRNHSQIEHDGLLYCIGGLGIKNKRQPESYRDERGNALKDVMVYNPERGYWKKRAPLRLPRIGPGLAKYGHRIYAVGGVDNRYGWLHHYSIECYDVTINTWTMTNYGLRIGRMMCKAYVFDYEMFVVGGEQWPSLQPNTIEKISMNDEFDGYDEFEYEGQVNEIVEIGSRIEKQATVFAFL